MAIRFTPGGEFTYVLAADRDAAPDQPKTEWTLAPLGADDFAEFQDLLGQKGAGVGKAFLFAFKKGVRKVTNFPGGLNIAADGWFESVMPGDRLEIGQVVASKAILETKEKD